MAEISLTSPELQEEVDFTEQSLPTPDSPRSKARNSSRSRPDVAQPKMHVPEPRQSVPPPKTKLRPIHDVISRLRHDPVLSSEDHSYTIMYRDRFDGLLSIPLSQWRNETTDDEFIPAHRVVRVLSVTEDDLGRPNQRILWDREERWDAIFNSGRGPPPAPATTGQNEVAERSETTEEQAS